MTKQRGKKVLRLSKESIKEGSCGKLMTRFKNDDMVSLV